MKFIIFISILFFSFNLSGQTFTLNDTSFTEEALFEIEEFDYSPCFRFNIDPNEEKKEKLLNFLLKNPKLSVEIQSHTDHRGSATYNLKLSQRRAETIVDYLIEKGIDKERVKAVGKGGTESVISEEKIKELIDNEEIEEAHDKNRRLVMKIVSIK